MKSRNLIILIAIVAGLAAYIGLVERHRPNTEEAEATARKVFPGVMAESVEGLEITASKGTVRLQKAGDEWHLVEPISFPADDAAVGSLLSTIVGLEAERRLAEDEVDPAAYGLNEPEMQLTMVTSDEARHVLRVGAKTPLGSNRAVSTGAPGVILVSGWFTNDLDKELDEWRSHDVVEIFPTDVASLEVEVGEDRIQAVRLNDDWKLLHPLQDQADREHIRSVISDLNALQVEAFADSAEAADLGLDSPRYRVTLLRTEGRDPLTLAFGSTREIDGETQVSCRRGDDLLWVKDSILMRLNRAPVRWRSAVVSPFETWDAERIVITAAELTLAADRSQGVWSLDDGSEADYTAIQERLTALSKLEAADFDLIDPPTAQRGSVELGLKDADAEDLRTVIFTFFEPLGEGGRALVTVSGRDTVMSIDNAAVEEILGDPASLRKPPQPVEPAEIPDEG